MKQHKNPPVYAKNFWKIWLSLPVELQTLVLSYVDCIEKFVNFTSVSKTTTPFMMVQSLWKKFTERDFHLKQVGLICKEPQFSWRNYYQQRYSLTVHKFIRFDKIKKKRELPKGYSNICPRFGQTISKVGNDVYIIGGEGEDNKRFNEIYKWDMENNVITQVPSHGMIPLSRHQSCSYQDKIYIFGGFDGVSSFNYLSVYDTTTYEWKDVECTGQVPSARSNHSCVVVEDYMYLFGGNYSPSAKEFMVLNDFYKLNLLTLKWTNIQDEAKGVSPSPRGGHRAEAVGSLIYIFGGGQWNNKIAIWDKLYNDIHIYDTIAMRWHQPETRGYTPLSCFSSICKIGYFLLFFGGNHITVDVTGNSNAYVFDTVTNTWFPIPSKKKVNRKCRDMVSLIKLEEKVLIFGGNCGCPVNDWRCFTFKSPGVFL